MMILNAIETTDRKDNEAGIRSIAGTTNTTPLVEGRICDELSLSNIKQFLIRTKVRGCSEARRPGLRASSVVR